MKKTLRFIRVFVAVIYIGIDLSMLALAFFLPYFFYYRIPSEFKIHSLLYAFWIVSTILLFYTSQLYLTVRELSIWREIRRVIRAFLFSTSATVIVLFLLKIQTFSRLVFIQNFIFALFVCIAWRITKRFFVRYLVAHGFNNFNVLIVGAGRMGIRLVDALQFESQLGLRIVGFLDDRIETGTFVKGYPILGNMSDFNKIARKYFAEQVFITIPSEKNIVSEIGFQAKLLGITIKLVPENFGFETQNIVLENIQGIPLLEYHTVIPNYKMIIIKRLMDSVFSGAALVLLSPLFFLITLAIKLDSSGPVFYSSKRWGQKGRLFYCHKFRSMVWNADDLKENLMHANEMDGPVFKIKDDPRVTRMGKWLRKYSLDELPQIWNVFKGDMSLVGPRPLPEAEEVGEYKLTYLNRLSIKPGLTCLWQIRGRNTVTFKVWMKLDDYYIRNWSPAMDISILLKTIPAVFKGKGAY